MIEAPEDLNAAVFRDYCAMLAPDVLGSIYREFLDQTRARLLSPQAPAGLSRSAAHTIAGTAGMLGAGRLAAKASRIEEGHPAGPDEIAAMLADCASLEARLREQQVEV